MNQIFYELTETSVPSSLNTFPVPTHRVSALLGQTFSHQRSQVVSESLLERHWGPLVCAESLWTGAKCRRKRLAYCTQFPQPAPAVTSQAKNMWWMARRAHQSSVIGPDLCCDWLISLICNHYCTERQLRQKKKKKKRIRKIKEVKNDTIRAVLSPRCLHTMPGIRQLAPHRGKHTHTPEDYKETPSKKRAAFHR